MAPYTGCSRFGGSESRVRDDFFEFIMPRNMHLYICMCACVCVSVWCVIRFLTPPRRPIPVSNKAEDAPGILRISRRGVQRLGLLYLSSPFPFCKPRTPDKCPTTRTYMISHYALRGRQQCIASPAISTYINWAWFFAVTRFFSRRRTILSTTGNESF